MTDETKTTHEDPNAKFLVIDITTKGSEGEGSMRTRVYLLNPGDVFAYFGGSRHGLCVKKTASLILSQSSPAMGRRDTEYDLTNADAWDCIVRNVIMGYVPDLNVGTVANIRAK
jgi:hypothetical protein